MFKIGDRVKVINPEEDTFGAEGTVIRVQQWSNDDVRVNLGDDLGVWIFTKPELEQVK